MDGTDAEEKEQCMAEEVSVTDDNFNEIVSNSKGLVLVDFGADWCMPCRMIAPTIEALAEEYKGRVAVGKLDVDKNQMAAARFSVTGIPTIMLFKDGEAVERLVGLQTAEALKAVLEKHLT